MACPPVSCRQSIVRARLTTIHLLCSPPPPQKNQSLEQGQNLKRITGLAFAPDGGRVYTASEGAAEVLEWDLKVRVSLARRP